MTNTKTNPCLPAAPRRGKSPILHTASCTMRHSAFRILYSALFIVSMAAMTVGTAFAAAPKISSVYTDAGTHTYGVGDTITFKVEITSDDDGAPVVSGNNPSLTLSGIQPGGTATAEYAGTYEPGLLFRYTVKPGDFSAGIGVSQFNSNEGTIYSTEGGDQLTNYTLPANANLAGETITIQTIVFANNGTRMLSVQGNKGDTIEVEVSRGGNGAAVQSFSSTVSTENIVSVGTLSIPADAANGICSIHLDNTTGNDPVTVTFHPVGYNGTGGDLTLSIRVNDAEVPHIEAVLGDYDEENVYAETFTEAGREIMILVKMNDEIYDVTGTPYLNLNVLKGTGDTENRRATYVDYSGKFLEFSYTVKAGDFVTDLDVVKQGFKLNGAAVYVGGTDRANKLSSQNANAIPCGTTAGSLSQNADISIRTVYISSTGAVTGEVSGREGDPSVTIPITRGGSSSVPLGFTITASEDGKVRYKNGNAESTTWIDATTGGTQGFTIPRGENSADLVLSLDEKTEQPFTLTIHPNGYNTNGVGNASIPIPDGDIVLTVNIAAGTKPSIEISGPTQLDEGSGIAELTVSLPRSPKVSTTVNLSSSATNIQFVGNTTLTWNPGDENPRTVSIKPLDGDEQVVITAKTQNPAYTNGTHTIFVKNLNPTIISPPADWEPAKGGEGFAYTVSWSGQDVEADKPTLYAVIHWGDGKTDRVNNAPQGSFQHVYNVPGSFGITIEIHDKDGGVATVSGTVEIEAAVAVVINEYKIFPFTDPNLDPAIAADVGQNAYKGLEGLGRGTVDDNLSETERINLTHNIDWQIKYSPATATATLIATPETFIYEGVDYEGNVGDYEYNSFFHVWLGDEDTFRSQWCMIPLSAPVTAAIRLRDGGEAEDRQVGAVFSREHYPDDNYADIDWDRLPDRWEILYLSALVDNAGGDEATYPFETPAGIFGEQGNPDNDFLPACVTGIDAITGAFTIEGTDFSPTGIAFINLYEVRGTHLGLNARNSDKVEELIDEPHKGTYDDDGNFTDNDTREFFGTDPTKADTDGDKLTDGYEYFFWRWAKFANPDDPPIGQAYDPTQVVVGKPIDNVLVEEYFNPCVANDHLTLDIDGDGLSNFEEFLLGTNPIHWDTDGDGMNDGWEVMWGLNPKDKKDATDNPDGDFMANDGEGGRLHADVYAHYGFDPRTGWNATYKERNRILEEPSPNTTPFSNYHEHYLGRWCIDHGFAYEVEPMSTTFMTQPVPYGTPRFYDPGWNGTARKVPNHSLTPSGVGDSGDDAATDVASATGYTVPAGDLAYLVESVTITSHGCDSDGDGMPDGWELYLCSSDGLSLDGLWPIGQGSAIDARMDYDQDNLRNRDECRSVELCDYYSGVCTNGSFTFSGNWYNKWWPCDIFDPDTDGDHLADGLEGDVTFRYQDTFQAGGTNGTATAEAFVAARFGDTTMLRGHVPGGGLNPCCIDTDMDYLPDHWEYLYAGNYRDTAWEGGFCNEPGTETGLSVQNGQASIALNGAGMDGTYFDSRSGYDECTHSEDRNFDFDGDGLENYQEYWINGVRHFQYDKWVAGGDYGDYDIQEIFDLGEFTSAKDVGHKFKKWNSPTTAETEYIDPLFMKWDWSFYADDWQNEGLPLPNNMFGVPIYPFHYMPSEVRPKPLGAFLYASTDPRLADSDGDGMDDFYEMFHGLNPILSDVIDYCLQAHPAGETYDFRQFPWMAGMPNADPDGDDIPNWEEALSPDQPAPANHNTDPSPLWFTDMSYDHSFVNLYYNWGSAANFWTTENPIEPAYEFYPYPGNMIPGMIDPRPHYVFDFESNEGFDTDNDNLSDPYEINGGAGGVTDAQNPDRPVGRKALYLDGNAAARTRSICAFGPNALRSFTLEAWVMPEEPASGKMQVILERPVTWDESNTSPTHEYIRRNFRLGLLGNGRPFVEFDNGGKNLITERAEAPEGGALEAGKWYHIAATMDGFSGKLALYVDGRRIASKATTQIPYTGFTDTALNAVGSQEYHQPRWSPVVIGASDANPVGQVDGSYDFYNGVIGEIPGGQPQLGDYFKGWIDEVRIWDGARPGGEDVGDQRVAFWRWPTIKDDYESLKRYGMDETIKAREACAQYLARIVDYRQSILDAKRPFSAAANFVTSAAGATNGTAAATNATALAASAAPLPQGRTFDEYRVEASTYILMTGGEDLVCRIPPQLLCVYNFDTLPDPDYEPVQPAKFALLNSRPIDYNGTPWWRGATDRSTVYTSVEAPYLFPQYIQNLVAWQPLGHIIREENGAMDVEYSDITGGTNGIPLFVYQPDHVANSKYWARYTKGGKALSELEAYEAYGADAVNSFPNSANPYGYRYETGIIVDEENHPLSMFQEAYDPEFAVLFNDLVPLRNARADMSLSLWDDPQGDNVGVNKDSDGDGLPDYWEVANGMNPYSDDENGNGIRDDMDDFDGDGLTNWYEFLAGLDPFDTTTDGVIPDSDADLDGDGLSTIQEQENETHPLHPDSDDDGWIDGYEVAYGSDPLDSLDPYRQRALMVGADGFAYATAQRYLVDSSFNLAVAVNPSAYPAAGYADIVSYKIKDDTWNYFVRLDSTGIVTAGFTTRDGSGEFTLAAPAFRALPLNAWTRIAFSYDYASHFATLLLDGEPVASLPVNARPAVYSTHFLKPVVIGDGFSGMIRNVNLAVPGEGNPRMDIRFDDGSAWDPAAGTDTYGVPTGNDLGGQAEDFAIATTNVPYGSVAYRMLPETAATLSGTAIFVDLDENLVPIDDNYDTDGDGLPDVWEIAHGLNPYNPDSDGDGVTDDKEDPDLDGLTNYFEYLAGTDPNNAKTDGTTFDGDADSDGDGLKNILEQLYGCDPQKVDTDDDGASDSQEVFGAFGHFTLPTSALSPAIQGIFRGSGTAAAFTENDVLAALRIVKSWTIESWVKGATSGVIVRRGTNATGVNYELGLEGGKPYARIAGVYNGAVDSALSVKAKADFAVKSDVWTHVAAVWNDETRTLAVYVDGVLAANVYKREIDLGVFAQDGLAPVVVGDGLSGYLDEVRIWDIARSGASIAATAFQTFEYAQTQPLVELRFDDFGETAENFGSAGGFLVGGDMMDGSVEPRLSPIAADQFVDSDADGIPDFWEIAIFGSIMACDPAGDEDEDGLSNLYEYYSYSFPLTKYTGDPAYGAGTNASLVSDANRDPDNDGLSNLSEQTQGTRPDLVDTDDDGWTDYEEVNGTTRGRGKVGVSDPLNPLSPAIPRVAKFNGSGTITVPQRYSKWLREWTVAAWVKPEAANSAGMVVARTYGEGSFNYALGVEKVSGVLTPYAQYTTELPDNQLVIVKAGVDEAPTFRDNNPDWLTLKAGEWTHIAATYTTTNAVGAVTNGLLTLYVDGTAVAWRQDALTGPFFGVGELVIGKGFKGLVDDVRIAPFKASESEIVSMMGGSPVLDMPPPSATNVAAVASMAMPEAVAGEYIVRFRDGVTKAASTAAVTALGGNVRRAYNIINAAYVVVPQGADENAFVAGLKADPSVLYVEPNMKFFALKAPNDTDYSKLWGLKNSGQTGGTAGCDIGAEIAWDYTTGSKEVVVAVIDTGVDYNHPDLTANMWTNPGEIPGNGVDDDGNGFIDDVYGWNFVTGAPNGDPMDDQGHGTHCAGTIGGVGNNGVGVAGVNWNVKIMALKFLAADGGGSTADAIGCVDYAVQMGAKLTSNSWGGGGYSQALYDAIKASGEAGMLFVAAAGNSGTDNDVMPHYPSSYDLDNIIAVAATDHNDEIASFSCYGATTVDIGAPGVDIYSTYPTAFGSYDTLSGTSMATPHVAGAVALIYAADPTLTAEKVKSLLFEYADPVPSLTGKCVTGARLNIGAIIPVIWNPGGDEPGIAGTRALSAHFRFDDAGQTVRDFARAFDFSHPGAYVGTPSANVTFVTDADEDLFLGRLFGDVDGDGLPDWWEEMVGFSPANRTDERDGDSDGDGLSNLYEFLASRGAWVQGLRGLDPFNPDTDNDGITDYDEDSDGDGLTNGEEQDTYLSNPGDPDTDDDTSDDVDDSLGDYAATDSLKPYVNRAVTFSGVNDESNTVVVKDKIDGKFTERFSADSWTVEAWVNPASSALSGEYALISRKIFATSAFNYELGISNGKPYVRFQSHSGGDEVRVSTGAAISDSKWTHLAATFAASDEESGTYGLLTLLVNGEPVASTDTRLHPAVGPGDLVFGSPGFKGQMLGMRVWREARANDIVKKSMFAEMAGGATKGLAASIRVDGNGFLKENCFTNQRDGKTPIVLFDEDPGDLLNPRITPVSWTLEAWVNTTEKTGVILGRRNQTDHTDNNYNYFIRINPETGAALAGFSIMWYDIQYTDDGVVIVYGQDNTINNLRGDIVVNDGKWHHIAYVRDETGAYLYVDGVLDSKQNSLLIPQEADYGRVYGADGPVIVGDEFVGWVDECRIWNKTRTYAEIRKYKNQGLHGDEDGLVCYFNFDGQSGEFVDELSELRNPDSEFGLLIGDARVDDTVDPVPVKSAILRQLARHSLGGAYCGRDGGLTLEDYAFPFGELPFKGWKYAGVLGSGVTFATQNPLSWTSTLDSDGDGLPDVWEVTNGLDPYNSDQDGNNIPDGFDDFDFDGLRNEAEYRAGLDPWNADSDADGILDYDDVPASLSSTPLSYGWLYTDADYVLDGYEYRWDDVFASPFRYDEHEDRDLDGWNNWSEGIVGTELIYNTYNEAVGIATTDNDENTDSDVTGVAEASIADKAANFPLPDLRATVDYYGKAIKGAKLVVHAYSREDMNGWPDAVFVKDFSADTLDTWPMTVTIGRNDLVYGHLRQGRNWFFAWFDEDGSSLSSVNGGDWLTWSNGEPAAIADNQLDGIDIGFDLNEVTFHLTDKAESFARFSWEGSMPDGNDVHVAILYSGNPVFDRVIQWPRTWVHEGDVISWNMANSGSRANFGLGALESTVSADNEVVRGFEVVLTPQQDFEADQWSIRDFCVISNWMHTASALDAPVLYGPIDREIVSVGRPEFRFSLDPEFSEFRFRLIRRKDESGGWTEDNQATVYDGRFVATGRFFNDATGKRDLVILKSPVAQSDLVAGNASFGRGLMYQWAINAYSPAIRGGTATAIKYFITANSSSDANYTMASSGQGIIDVNLSYPSGMANSGSSALNIRVQAFRSRSFNGLPDASISVSSFGRCRIAGLEDGQSYYIRAYIEQNGDSERAEWESWGYYRAGNGAANPYLPVPVKAVRGGNASSPYGITIQDCDTDNDLLPDAYEWATAGNFSSLGVANYAPTVKKTVAYGVSPLAVAAAVNPGTGYALLANNVDYNGDDDGDGFSNGLEYTLFGEDAAKENKPQSLRITSVSFNDDGGPVLDWMIDGVERKRGGNDLQREVLYEIQAKVALTDAEWTTIRRVYSQSAAESANVAEETEKGVDVSAFRFFRVKLGNVGTEK